MYKDDSDDSPGVLALVLQAQLFRLPCLFVEMFLSIVGDDLVEIHGVAGGHVPR